jgi:Cu(I)/Ag(I) efflux system membrane protein CusA/SilA
MIETTIMLKPEYMSPTGRYWFQRFRERCAIGGAGYDDGKAARPQLSEKLTQVPGYVPGFLQPIETRTLMISTGIRAQVGVKILGDNLAALKRRVSKSSASAFRAGASGVAPSRVQGKPTSRLKRTASPWRAGLRAQDVLDVSKPGLAAKSHHHDRGPPAFSDSSAPRTRRTR